MTAIGTGNGVGNGCWPSVILMVAVVLVVEVMLANAVFEELQVPPATVAVKTVVRKVLPDVLQNVCVPLNVPAFAVPEDVVTVNTDDVTAGQLPFTIT